MPRMTTPQQGSDHSETDGGQMAGWRPAETTIHIERASDENGAGRELRRVTAPLSLRARRR